MKIIISWQVTQSLSMLKIDQLTFICNLIEEKSMQDCNLVSTSIKIGNFIEMQGKNDYKKVDLEVYQYLIGKLIYLFCRTRLDISFVIR